MLDKLRERLIATNINFRHISAGFLLIITALYTVASISWMVGSGANSPLQTGKSVVLPPFLAIEGDAKTLVAWQAVSGSEKSPLRINTTYCKISSIGNIQISNGTPLRAIPFWGIARHS